MPILVPSRAFVAAGIAVVAVAMAGSLVLRPAIASDGSIRIGPFALVTCSQPSPGTCEQYKNTNSGVGVEGDSASGIGVKGTAALKNGSTSASGVYGVASKGLGVQGKSTSGYGVFGTTISGSGVGGFSTTGTGVQGVSSSWHGVTGLSGSEIGVYGTSSSSDGVYGDSATGIGIEAFSTGPSAFYSDAITGYSVEAHGRGSQPSVYAAPKGTAMAGWFDSRATGNTNYGIVVYSQGAPAIIADNLNGTGADINGSSMGVIGRAPAAIAGTYPFIATDESNNSLFWVDGSGQVYAHGYNTFTRAQGGGIATTYGSVATSPTIEDNGTAQLIDGVADVRLDAAFSRTIDARRAYQVMLTPDGDTRGLYVASKSTSGFVVREVQGGRSSISFDYHIYGPMLGRADVRMQLVNKMADMPLAPIRNPGTMRPSKVTPFKH